VPLLEWARHATSEAASKCRVRIEPLAELGHELRRPEADFVRDEICALQGQNFGMHYLFHARPWWSCRMAS